MLKKRKMDYIIWQNRAFRFYLAARLLYENKLHSPAVFCAFQAIENLLKATLIYGDANFDPKDKENRHNIVGMASKVKQVRGKKNKFLNFLSSISGYQGITRYPTKGRGVVVQTRFLPDLDRYFVMLVELVPYQFNSELLRVLKKPEGDKQLKILSHNNKSLQQLKRFLRLQD